MALDYPYFLGLICEGARNHPSQISTPVGRGGLEQIENALVGFVREVQAEQGDESNLIRRLGDDIGPIRYAVNWLTEFFASTEPSHDDRMTAIIFSRFLFQQVPVAVAKYSER